MNYAKPFCRTNTTSVVQWLIFPTFLIVWRVTVSHILQPRSWLTCRSPSWPLLQVLELCAMCRSRTTKVIHTYNCTQFSCSLALSGIHTWHKEKVTVMQLVVCPRSVPPVAFCVLAPRCFPNIAYLYHFPVFQRGNTANVKCFPWRRGRGKISSRWRCVSLSGLETKESLCTETLCISHGFSSWVWLPPAA